MTDGCNGSCCKTIIMYKGIRRQSLNLIKKKSLKNPDDQDLKKVANMLVPYDFIENKYDLRVKNQHKKFILSCINFNHDTKKCNDYENRPNMCKYYPNDGFYEKTGTCKYEGCTFNGN